MTIYAAVRWAREEADRLETDVTHVKCPCGELVLHLTKDRVKTYIYDTDPTGHDLDCEYRQKLMEKEK